MDSPRVENYIPREHLGRIINSILNQDSKISPINFLKKLWKEIVPENSTFEISKIKRHENESVEEAVLRYARIAENSNTDVKWDQIIFYLSENEGNKDIAFKLHEKYLDFEKPSIKGALDIAQKLDKLFRLNKISHEKATHEDLIKIDAMSKNVYSNPKSSVHKYDKKCVSCKQDFNSKGRFRTCFNCHVKKITKHSHDKRESRSVLPTCGQCNRSPVSKFGDTKCRSCYIKRNFSQVQDFSNNSLNISSYLSNTIKQHKSSRISVSVKEISGKMHEALVDSGATHNLIQRSNIPNLLKSDAVPYTEIITCSGFNGELSVVEGYINLKILVDGTYKPIRFEIVSKILGHDMILGAPFLQFLGIMDLVRSNLEQNQISYSLKN